MKPALVMNDSAPMAPRRRLLNRSGPAAALLLASSVLPLRPLQAAQAASPGAAAPWEVPGEPLPPMRWSALALIDELLIPLDRPWRQPQRTLVPRHITVHSLSQGDALTHGQVLMRGLRSEDPNSRTGYVSWHFTVDASRVVQHLPVNEQADHADFQGPGNRESVAVEMAAGEGMTPAQVLHRSAFLVARLMRQHDIPAARVVPHQHWPRPPEGARKACPSVLLEGGVPAERWRRFVALAQAYRSGLDKYRPLPPII